MTEKRTNTASKVSNELSLGHIGKSQMLFRVNIAYMIYGNDDFGTGMIFYAVLLLLVLAFS